MNNRHAKTGRMGLGLFGVTLAVLTACAWGGLAPPLYMGNTEAARDQYGRPMIGSYPASAAANRSRVEIRTTTQGVILPPSTTGAAHPYNPMLNTESVGGVGMNAAEPNCGLFCMVFPERPAPGTKVFARAFNAPTLAEASFYADSALVELESHATSLVVAFGPAQPLDSGDADGDGLNNAWEKALGIDDRLTGDYDGDGMGDYHEMLAGTAPDDPGSNLSFRSIRREAGTVPAGAGGGTLVKPVNVKWQSVPGKSYQLQYVPTLVGEQVFIDVGEEVVAGEGEYELEMLVDVPEGAVAGVFRVKLVVEE